MLEDFVEIAMKCPVFKGLNANEMESVLVDCDCSIRSYKKNEYVVYEGDECRHLRIVLTGTVKGEMIDFSGKTIKIEDIYPPNPLAPAFLFGHQNVYPVNIVANEKTNLLTISKDSIIAMMLSDKRILINYLDFMSNRAQFLSRKLKFLSFQTIKGKLSHYIMNLSKSRGAEFSLDKSQSELSELFGVTRPSIGRAIRELNDQGIIHVEGKKVKIISSQALSSLLK